jgi:hypothetical protein
MKRLVLITASAAAILAAVFAGYSSSGTTSAPEQTVSTSDHAKAAVAPCTVYVYSCHPRDRGGQQCYYRPVACQ